MLRAPTIEPRDLRFRIGGPSSSTPRHWLGGRRAATRFFDNLSLFFPVGERFFIHTLKLALPRVHDPKLRREVKAFNEQEGHHGREHDRYNRFLHAQGIGTQRMEREVTRLLAVVRRLPARLQLAATCALEHFTAMMGHSLLSKPWLLDGADPELAALWRWHAAEENEHKAVAFDVFVAVGGTVFERRLAMVVASAIFWSMIVEQQLRLMAADGVLWSRREWRDMLTSLWGDRGALRGMWPHYAAYFRRSFHPLDIDSHALVQDWRAQQAGTQASSI
ncbi:metal-dependent hydrolase [Paraliomyxa miuraensis]|uniref:metal-dependent hydrolase n=1 Tax=Paraliomyxa miuraensis TaxID=376150 RepID=UPI002250B368|nr:metal-dependent hydrolase [Paraliomyxa miuraensis]MCX4245900.1 metal-dependent hydrolase [Paraliomyxa miuraensis]